MEEWASFEEHQFRLDMIYGDSRVTYLTNGETNEIFRYSAFKCDRLEMNSKDLGIIGNLFKGYSLNGLPQSARAYGLGPLWLRATTDATSDKLLSNKTSDNKDHKFLHYFTGYQLNFKFSREEIPYNLRFYFKQDHQSIVDAIEWLDPTNKYAEPKVEARATVVWVDLNKLAESVFELPVGYGCQRRPNLERAPQVGDGLELLHQGGPNQAVLEVTISQPTSKLLHNWSSHKYTVRMLRGQLKLNGSKRNSYYVSQIQERDLITSRMRRTKRVWSFEDKTNEAVVYVVDLESKKCQVTHESVEDSVKLIFPGQQNGLNPIALNIQAITNLFNSNEEYHFIKESRSSSSSRVKDVYFEKRLTNYQIKSVNKGGGFAFDGPISIVKKLSTLTFIPEGKQFPGLQTYQFSFHTKVTLFLYSQDLTEILYKIVIDLIDRQEVDISFMHKQLDVSPCFSEEQQKDIVIKYPIETVQLGKKLSVIQDLVEEYYCMNLFSTTPIQPLQVTNVGFSYDNFFIYIRMTLIDLPLTHFFLMQRGVRLAKGSDRDKILEKFAANAERCASSCELYHCLRFSFERDTSRCALQLHPNVEALQHSEFSELYMMESPWDKYIADGLRSHLKPRQIVELFNELITSDLADKDDEETISSWRLQDDVPLTLRIESAFLPGYTVGDPPFIILRPSSVESEMNSLHELAKVETMDRNTNGSEVIIHVNTDSLQLQIEYSLLFENKQYLVNKLASSPGSQQMEAFSYEDCAHACEDSNCKSFSYCQSDKSCSLTTMHKTALIDESVVHYSGCNVFVLDYLSKFEDLGFVTEPEVVQKIIKQESLIDCANSCMEEEEFNCQGFYHANEGDVKCLLVNKHIEQHASGPTFTFIKSTDKQSFRFYSRSNLAQFSQYFGKTLEVPETELNKIETIEGSGAELCAQTCIEQSCLAFDICLELDDAAKNLKQVCQLVKQQVRKSYLVARNRCNTFVLSDRSQFNRKNMKILQVDVRPDRTALDKVDKNPEIVLNPEQKEATRGDINEQLMELLISAQNKQELMPDSFHWLAKIFTIFLGSILGIGCASLWKKNESVRDFASRFLSGFRGR